MTILIKENDKYTSNLHKGRFILEYIIYLMIGEVATEAFLEVGETNKDKRLKNILETHGESEISYITFEEFKN